jgi:hypothetical protein
MRPPRAAGARWLAFGRTSRICPSGHGLGGRSARRRERPSRTGGPAGRRAPAIRICNGRAAGARCRLSSADSSLLPQTHDQPQASGPAFDARVAALWDGIVHDDPDRAMPFFFPVGAYQQVKDVPDPAADWKHRLVAAYKHDIHALHARLGDGAAGAKLDGLDVPEARARWVEPGEEYNKIGYYRVFGSKLRYEIDGKPASFDVKSLISWRGEWFVVHLSAIK